MMLARSVSRPSRPHQPRSALAPHPHIERATEFGTRSPARPGRVASRRRRRPSQRRRFHRCLEPRRSRDRRGWRSGPRSGSACRRNRRRDQPPAVRTSSMPMTRFPASRGSHGQPPAPQRWRRYRCWPRRGDRASRPPRAEHRKYGAGQPWSSARPRVFRYAEIETGREPAHCASNS